MNSKGWIGIARIYSSIKEMISRWSEGHYVVGAPVTVKLEGLLWEKYGVPSLAMSMGRNAILATVWALTRPGDVIVVSKDIYPGTKMFFQDMEKRGILKVRWATPESVFGQVEGAKLVFFETIGNSMHMPAINPGEFSSFIGRENPECFFILDSTFTPEYCPTAEMYVNTVLVGSMTKYELLVHEVTGGRISAKKEVIDLIKASGMYSGCAMQPGVARFYLENNSFIMTGERWKRHSANALALIKSIKHNPAIAEICYPPISHHEIVDTWYEIVGTWYGGSGGVFYLVLNGGNEAAEKLADALAGKKSWQIAASFGTADWRIFPFVGPLEQHSEKPGLVRIAVGSKAQKDNIKAFQEALSSLK